MNAHTLHRMGRIEGVSLLLLLGVAMPLKYLAGQPLAVTVVGSVHGALWVIYMVMLGRMWMNRTGNLGGRVL